jgi:HlyD family secretion protein
MFHKMNRIIIIIFLISFCQSKRDAFIETHEVKKNTFVSSVTETGELAAVNSEAISAPSISWRFGALKITKLVDDGKQVEKGELLVEFDKAEVQKNIIDAKAELEIAKAELRKALASNVSQIEELEADLESTTLQHRISELNLEKASYESEIRRKEIELNLEKSTISLKKAKQEIENQKKINSEEVNKLELKVKQVENKLEQANETLAKLSVFAPAPGIAIIKKSWMTDNKYQVDDQPYPGWPLIGLPDLSQIKASVQINEVDIAKIDTSQKAVIRLDAFPENSFKGKVTEIARLARNKERDSKVKIFDVTILLFETDVKLMPGMTVSCEIIIKEIQDTLFIPLEALFKQDENNIVYLKNDGGFETKPVSIGMENDDFVIITEGLSEGDEIALSDPTIIKTKKSKKETKK